MKDIKIKLKELPKSPGIYFFKNKKKEIIYVGKANDLRARVRQYFARTKEQHPKITALVSEIAHLDWQECQSEIDTLIEEAKNIKKYRPKFNVLLRDDKNYFFVAITKEIFPRIFITHQPVKIFKADFIGPFTEGKSLKQVLKILRKIYPYCACKTHAKRPCLQYHLGLCLGPSIHPERKKAIRQNISAIKQILNGKRQTLLKKMKSQMMESAKKENFIKAEELKNKIKSLENIFAHRLFLGVDSSQAQAQRWDKAKSSLQAFLKSKKEIRRVEGYDISNIGGQYAVGSMVVFENGEPNKSQYRKFKIKYSGTEPNDPKMMAEILARRMRHAEWPAPDLIIVDGGITQLNAARSVLPKNQPVISLAKKEEEIYIPGKRAPIPTEQISKEFKLFAQHLRDEAHRFAIAYHRKLRSASFK